MLQHPRYEARGPLGEGGTSRVLQVVDREQPTKRLVAKTWAGKATDPEAFARLQGEFALLARLSIGGLVRVHDFGRDATGAPFLVEDYVGVHDSHTDIPALRVGRAEGADFRSSIGQDANRLRRWLVDVLATLAALHDAGFVHGDLKPDHVRIDREGRPVLVDLGCALRIGRGSHEAKGLTRAFAAPEVIAGNAPDVRSDLYGLGATVLACIDSSGASTRRSGEARIARWVPPSIADVIIKLVAPHPADRPESARAALTLLGRDSAFRWEAGGRACVGRESVISAALTQPSGGATPSVRFVVGPSGAGKSHVLREVAIRALAAGRDVRVLAFPATDPELVAALIAHLRTPDAASPFVGKRDDTGGLLLVVDDLQRAPAELAAALDAFRCRPARADDLEVLAGSTSCPNDATRFDVGPLDTAAFSALCNDLGVTDADEVARLATASGGLPGWLLASVARVTLDRDAILERLRDYSEEANLLMLALALAEGSLAGTRAAELLAPSDLPGTVAELARAGLVARRGGQIELTTPHLSNALGLALATFARIDRLAQALLASDRSLAPARFSLRLAQAETPPARRSELLALAAERAAVTGEREEEIEALFAIAATREERTFARVAKLERLARDSGQARIHPEVLAWLDELAATNATARSLATRRHAEIAARTGKLEEAVALAARAVAESERDAIREGYAHATAGAIAIYGGNYASADDSLRRARTMLDAASTRGEALDREEIARLLHNQGVVALVKGRTREAVDAFERSAASKRALGDRAGVRSCLLNLGHALAQLGDYERAEATLEEAIRLARALGQTGGLAWCLAARADLEVRRAAPATAARFVDEASAIGDAVPAVVRADLALLRADIAILEGDGRRALTELEALDSAAKSSDAMIAIRDATARARAALLIPPVDRRVAARSAVTAIRQARSAQLYDLERAAQAALHAARAKKKLFAAPAAPPRYDRAMLDPAFDALTAFAAGASAESAIHSLLCEVRARSDAERAFLVSGSIAFAVDVDDDALADALRKVPAVDRDAAGGFAYRPDVATRAGRGSMLAVWPSATTSSTVLIVEHRFQRAAFDDVDVDELRRFCVVGAVLLRAGSSAPNAAPATTAPRHPTTAAGHPRSGADQPSTTDLPLRRPTRDFPGIIGASESLARALAKLESAAQSDLPVVLAGETGTGKELFARAVHDHGPRASRPFVAINCAAIADSLFEAELFGHARGAFTGADRARPGLMVRAEGGTLFLDEIGELSLARQATLLRVLESRMLRPVGSDEERAFDVRIVCATHRDLDAAVASGAFRADLLFRLRVLEVSVPALRDRPEDIGLLARHFLKQAGSRAAISKRAEAALQAYAWPGNVRELAHTMQRLAAAKVERVESRNLPRAIRAAATEEALRENSVDHAPQSTVTPEDARQAIERALASTNGNISQAATLLGVTRHGLKKRMVRLGLRRGES